MTSYFISGSVGVEKVENPNFFVFHQICMKFGMRSSFEMLITKGKPKQKLENDLSKKLQFSTDFSQTIHQALFNNSNTMATVDVP